MQILTYVFDAHCRFRTGKVLMDASINLGKDSRESSLSAERMRKAQKTCRHITGNIAHQLDTAYVHIYTVNSALPTWLNGRAADL